MKYQCGRGIAHLAAIVEHGQFNLVDDSRLFPLRQRLERGDAHQPTFISCRRLESLEAFWIRIIGEQRRRGRTDRRSIVSVDGAHRVPTDRRKGYESNSFA